MCARVQRIALLNVAVIVTVFHQTNAIFPKSNADAHTSVVLIPIAQVLKFVIVSPTSAQLNTM